MENLLRSFVEVSVKEAEEYHALLIKSKELLMDQALEVLDMELLDIGYKAYLRGSSEQLLKRTAEELYGNGYYSNYLLKGWHYGKNTWES